MYRNKYLISFACGLVVLFSSCTKQAPSSSGSGGTNPTGNNGGGSGTQPEHNLYLMAHIADGHTEYAATWRNGVRMKMNDSGTYSSVPRAMAVIDTIIYVCGYNFLANNSIDPVPMIWKNGNPNQTILQDPNLGSPPTYEEYWTVAAFGNDLYVGGDYWGQSNQPGVCWKNGVPVVLGYSSSGLTSVRSVYVSGTDVYTGGLVSESLFPDNQPEHPCYWKNGQITIIFPGDANAAVVNGIGVIGDDVYAVGQILFHNSKGTGPRAYLWKNGVPSFLYDSTQFSTTTGIQIVGQDVFISGYVLNGSNIQIACYWKNGVQVVLGDGTNPSEANAIFVTGNDIYVAGEVTMQDGTTYGEYWKNGVATILPSSGAVVTELLGIYYK